MTSHAVSSDGFSLKRCILDAIFSGMVALIIFGPIVGVVLDGYSFNFAGPGWRGLSPSSWSGGLCSAPF
jgi:branched-chain amino acid transport system permease protein